MPIERIVPDGTKWDKNDWYVASACSNCSAALEIVPSAGEGYYNYISNLFVSCPSGNLITITDGTSATIAQLYTTASGSPTSIFWDRGMEYRCPTVGQNIKMKQDVSATVYFMISGFKYPYIAG